jgi:hypothetical protein
MYPKIIILSSVLFLSNAQLLKGDDEDDFEENASVSSWGLAFYGLGSLYPFLLKAYAGRMTGAVEFEDVHVGSDEIVPLEIKSDEIIPLEIKKEKDAFLKKISRAKAPLFMDNPPFGSLSGVSLSQYLPQPTISLRKTKTNKEIEAIAKKLNSHTQEIDDIIAQFEYDRNRVEEDVHSSMKVERQKLRRASKKKRESSSEKFTEKAVQDQIKERTVSLINDTYEKLRAVEDRRQAFDSRIFKLLTVAAENFQFRQEYEESVLEMQNLCSDLKGKIEKEKKPLRLLYKEITGIIFPKKLHMASFDKRIKEWSQRGM